jgi:hypothetical protein
LKDLFIQDEKLNQIACFADAFGLLNEMNNFLQGHNSRIIELCHKIKCFQMRLDLWLPNLKGKKIYLFVLVADRLEDSKYGSNVSLLSEIKAHLLSLNEISRYFPDISNKPFPLVKSLFVFYVD